MFRNGGDVTVKPDYTALRGSANQSFTADHDRLLLECYFGAATPPRMARLNLMKIMSDMREALWGLVQTGISRIDFDFRSYSECHFERATAGFHDPQFKEWLNDSRYDV